MDEYVGYILVLIFEDVASDVKYVNDRTNQRMAKHSTDFTRTDLTVTLVCAVFLFVTLGAVGTRGREHAKRILCASQLAKWGKAIIMQSADNNDKLMFIIRRWPGWLEPLPHNIAALPLRFYGDPQQSQPHMIHGEFSVYLIKPYIDIISDDFENNGRGTRLLACPSTNSDFMVDWNWVNWSMMCQTGGEYYLEPGYAYWGIQTPEPITVASPGKYSFDGEGSANIHMDLTDGELSPSRLLMSDVIAMDVDMGVHSYLYNHGRKGWSWASLDWNPPIQQPVGHTRYDGEQDATGRNQLFGDGRVSWRPISLEPEDNVPGEVYGGGFTENEWNGAGSGWMVQYDIKCYY
jgi:hypothetical protein